MSVSWDSLKLRLALTAALLMGLGVAATVIRAVHDAQGRAEQSVIESNLGVGQIASMLSSRLIEHQRALVAAAREWKQTPVREGAEVDAFVARQSVLRTLFDRVLVVDRGSLGAASGDLLVISPPVGNLAAEGTLEVVVGTPLNSTGRGATMLAGTLSLRGTNFLSSAAAQENVGDSVLQTIVADQSGRVLAHSDPQRLLSIVDNDPQLRETVARWRSQGAPLEPTPWAGHVGGFFVAMAAVPGTNWIVFRDAPAEAVLGRANRSILRTAETGVSVAIIGAAAIFGVTAWLLHPMSRLQRRALKALDPAQPACEGWPVGRGEVGQLSRVLQHVSEELAASRSKMERSLRQMQAVLEHAPTGIAFTTDNRFELVSNELERMLGYDRGRLDGMSCEPLVPRSLDGVHERAHAALLDGRSFESELQLRRRDGSMLWTHVRGVVVPRNDAALQAIWIVSDATNARRQRERLVWNATRDPLTELVNRREFEDQLRRLVADRRRHAPACALFIDLDHFKQVNDTVGHGAGDALLRRVGQALQKHVRDDDTVARLGGDEFAVLLRACDPARAVQIAEQIRQEVQSRGEVAGTAVGVTASIGVVRIDGSCPTLAAVLEAADRACYAAKHAGRNSVRYAGNDRSASLTGT